MRPKIFLHHLRQAFSEWLKDDASLLAAALAYYGLVSLVPLLIIILIFINSLFHYGLLSGEVAEQAQDLASRQAPSVVDEWIDRAGEQAASFRFTLFSVVLLLLGAAGLFVQTKRAFRIIWSLPEEKAPITETIHTYLRSFLLITMVAFLLLVTSFITAVLLPLGRHIEEILPLHLGLLRPVTLLISFTFVTILFAATYKTLVEVELEWRDVLWGSVVAALLFAAGNFVIEYYVSVIDLGSAYEAAGSLVVLLIWIYYSAQIFLFGAELIKVQKRGVQTGEKAQEW